MVASIIILVIVLILVIWYISTMNGLRAAALKVDEADSGIDVALTKRYDVLTKQLDAVREYVTHETITLHDTIRMRSGMSLEEKTKASKKMNKIVKEIQVVAEAYPELKSSNNFVQLQEAITDVEEHLQAARRLYNANVTSYNTKIVMFPASIVAGMLGMQKRELFQAEDYKKEDVNIIL